MRGVDKFDYHKIVAWNGQEGEHEGVRFIADKGVFVMNARWQILPGKKYMEVRFNPAHLALMSPPARYVALMHELAHLHYEHPGNAHPESMLNEVQADDTALVNAITLYPAEAPRAVADLADFVQKMEDAGFKGGGTHPDNPTRKSRLHGLLNAILDRASVTVHIQSNFTPEAQMRHFLQLHGEALLIERQDVKDFKAENGKFCYVDGHGTVKLRKYLEWLPVFRHRAGLNLIPGLRFTWAWSVRPVVVQNQVKDMLPGAVK